VARYAFRSITTVVPTGTNAVQFLDGNPSRVSLIVASHVSSSMRLAANGGSSFEGLWNVISSQLPTPLTYRDFGPVIQYPLFVSHTSGGNVTITVTEIYRLPGC
jgi:hypothetical protein